MTTLENMPCSQAFGMAPVALAGSDCLSQLSTSTTGPDPEELMVAAQLGTQWEAVNEAVIQVNDEDFPEQLPKSSTLTPEQYENFKRAFKLYGVPARSLLCDNLAKSWGFKSAVDHYLRLYLSNMMMMSA